MDVRTCLRLVRRHWWIVLVTLMVTLGSAALVTVRTPPRYVASVTFFVTAPRPGRQPTPTRAGSFSSSA